MCTCVQDIDQGVKMGRTDLLAIPILDQSTGNAYTIGRGVVNFEIVLVHIYTALID